jgi:hypothetical protein
MLSTRLSLVAVVLGGAACASVQQVADPATFIPRTNPDVVVVTYADNSVVPFAKPHMSGDTLLGTWAGLGEAVAVPLSQVHRVDAKQRDRKKTTFFIVGLTAFAALGVYALTNDSQQGQHCDYSAGGPGDNCIGEGYDGPGP